MIQAVKQTLFFRSLLIKTRFKYIGTRKINSFGSYKPCCLFKVNVWCRLVGEQSLSCRTFKYSAPHKINSGHDVSSGKLSEAELSASHHTGIEESFADYGLGGHVYPHNWLQSGMEFIHNGLDIGWMPTIALITVALRILAIPTYIKMRQFNVRSHNHLPEQLEIQASMMNGNPIEKQRKKLEMMEFLKEKGLNPLKPLLYSLPISAIFVSFFAALRGISEAKLPSFVNGGVLWFSDLTVADPYYVLPLLSCVSLHLLIRFGAATAEVGAAESIPLFKKILLWSPFVFYPFAVFQPACMFIFWMTSNFFSLLLMFLFSNRTVRSFCGIPEQKRHSTAVLENMKKLKFTNIIENAKKQAALRDAALKKVNNHIDKINKTRTEKMN